MLFVGPSTYTDLLTKTTYTDLLSTAWACISTVDRPGELTMGDAGELAASALPLPTCLAASAPPQSKKTHGVAAAQHHVLRGGGLRLRIDVHPRVLRGAFLRGGGGAQSCRTAVLSHIAVSHCARFVGKVKETASRFAVE